MSGYESELRDAVRQAQTRKQQARAVLEASILRCVQAGDYTGLVAQKCKTTNETVQRVAGQNGLKVVTWHEWQKEGGEL